MIGSRSRLRAVVAGRRAGKSWGIAAWLIIGALIKPGTIQLFLAITRKSAKRIIWKMLKDIDHKYRLGCEFKLGDLIMAFPNGSEVHVSGCPDASHVDTFRGTPYFRIALDEGASFPPSFIHALIDDALIPATADYKGCIIFAGTPGVAPVGYLYEAHTGQIHGWEMHGWTMLDNPHMPDPLAEIQDYAKRRNWPMDHPSIQREWLGKWVADLSMLVYGHFNTSLVESSGPRDEDGPWHYVLGLDFGDSETRESMAYSLLAYSDKIPVAWVVETKGEKGATPATCAATVHKFEKRYRDKIESIVGDPGSLGAEFIKQLRQRYRIPIEPAEKANKRGYIELLNGDMKSGLLKFKRDGTEGVVGEMKILPWADERRLIEKDKVANHQSDATLYAWRRCRQYDAEPDPDPPPKVGTPEHSEERERQIEAALVRHARDKKSRPWWQ